MKVEAFLVSSVIGASGAVPLVLAQAAPGATVTQSGVVIPVWAISIVATGTLAFVGYLLKRSWEQVDRTLEKLDARVGSVEHRMHEIERKL